jgi:hypothetical protein
VLNVEIPILQINAGAVFQAIHVVFAYDLVTAMCKGDTYGSFAPHTKE